MSYVYISAGLCPPDIFSDNNSIYVTAGLLPNDVSYEVATSHFKLGQIFYVYGQFVPSKVSVYIRMSGNYNVPYFDITSPVAIDALNFSNLTQSQNKNIPYEKYDDYSAKGSLYTLKLYNNDNCAIVYYPIKGTTGTVNMYIRSRTSTGRFIANIYLDEDVISTINQIAPVATWGWIGQTFNITDDNIHTIGIQMLEDGNAVDRICISQSVVVPDNVNDYQNSFLTLHYMIYSTDDNDQPKDFINIYDYKTSLDELRNDDWYNFGVNFLDNSLSIPFTDKYAIVLFSSGGSQDNFLVWELTDNNDPYICGPSAIKI